MKEKIKQFIKKYYPDIIILAGIWILSYKILLPVRSGIQSPSEWLKSGSIKTYNQEWKLFGIMLIAIGIDIVIRKYLTYKQTK